MTSLALVHVDDLLDRLSRLPRKVAVPLSDLLARDQLSRTALATILDAGELSGQRDRLLGFAVAYHHLKMDGVPLDDAIRMAKEQGRRIRLDWSKARWKSEHNRFARMETLIRLSTEDVRYDVEKYARHLPSFPGYLIRSSRRLGMEGLRQRHCIASYHDQIVHGYTAIAAVFVDGVRWTVQLHLNHDPERPLRITQIKSRFNELASRAVRERIHDLLGVEDAPAGSVLASSWQDQGNFPEKSARFRENLLAIREVLLAHGVPEVVVRFDGSGDSGSIDEVNFPSDIGFDPEAVQVAFRKTCIHRSADNWQAEIVEERVDVAHAVELLVTDYLEITGVNWYDNDGGWGEFSLDVESGEASMEINVRLLESSCEFSEVINLDELAAQLAVPAPPNAEAE